MLYTEQGRREERREGWREEGTVLAFPVTTEFQAAEFDDRKRNGNISNQADGAVHSFRPGFFRLTLCL